jgi:hypothetical protein
MTQKIPEILTTEIVSEIIIDQSRQIDAIDAKAKSLVNQINQAKMDTSKTKARDLRSLSNQLKSVTEQVKAIQDFVHNVNIRLLSFIKQENVRDITMINCQCQINALYNQINLLLTSIM